MSTVASETKWLPLFLSFIEKLRINSKEVASVDERGAPLELWDSQRIFLEQVCAGMEEGVRTFFCLKARQLGISTVSLAIDIFWLAIHPGINGALVTDTEGNRDVFRATLKRYIDSFPKGYLGKAFTLVKDNRNFMLFSNGSRLDFLVAGTRRKTTWGEGRGYSFCHATEVANYGDPEGLSSFRETLAEQHPDRLFIYESTAKGFNHWRDMYIEGRRDTLTKRSFFIGWWAKEINAIKRNDKRFAIYGSYEPDERERELIDLVKERHNFDITREQLAWFRWRASDSSGDDAAVMQNTPWSEDQAFVMTGYSFFQTRVIQQDMARIYDNPPLFKGYKYWMGNDFFSVKLEQIYDEARLDEVELRIWEEPKDTAQYVIGVDPAFGRNDWKDRHAIEVYRCYADKMVQVAEFATAECETRQAAWALAHIAGAYKDCLLNVELSGGPGHAVMTEFTHLRDRLRAEMYNARRAEMGWEDFLNTARWYLYHKPDSPGRGYAYNFLTTRDSKWRIMNQLRDSYVTGLLDISSPHLLEEMLVVVQDGSEIGAPGRSKDDRVFATALANLTWAEWVRPGMIAQGLTLDAVQRAESGEARPANQFVDRMVANYFRRAAEQDEGDAPPKWLTDRGLA